VGITVAETLELRQTLIAILDDDVIMAGLMDESQV
jgi:hypothetical protein